MSSGFRVVVITKKCKLSYKDGYLVVRSEVVDMIHLAEIHTLLIDSTMVLLTSYLLCELIQNGVKVIFCNESRNPISELLPYYDSYHCSGNIKCQIGWGKKICGEVFKKIVEIKLRHQAKNIYHINQKRADMINGVQMGYLTQIGIHHKNEYNPFNLSCDFMEPFRPLVDKIVKANEDNCFNQEYKMKLVNLLNLHVLVDGKKQSVANAIKLSTRSVLKALQENDVGEVQYFCYEG